MIGFRNLEREWRYLRLPFPSKYRQTTIVQGAFDCLC